MLAMHPAGRRPPTPAPRATKEVTLGGRGAAPRRPPSAEARRTARQTRGAIAASRSQPSPLHRAARPQLRTLGPSRAAFLPQGDRRCLRSSQR